MPREVSVPRSAPTVKPIGRQGSCREIPTRSGGTGNTELVAANIIYGSGIPDDRELRLCGDVADGWRAVELGVSPWRNAGFPAS